jgi:chromosome segregation ATPase
MQVGLTEAAKLTGKNPSTLTRAAQAGKVSFTTDKDGSRLFDIAELERAFGPLKTGDDADDDASDMQSTITHEQLEQMHEREKSLLREQIRMLERQIDDLKADREKWQQQAGQITRLLTDERSTVEKARDEAARAREEAVRMETEKKALEQTVAARKAGIIGRLLGQT